MSDNPEVGAETESNETTGEVTAEGSPAAAERVASAAGSFISELRTLLGVATQAQFFDVEERRNMERYITSLNNEITTLKSDLTKCGMELNKCQSRDCIEDDPDSVENMSHYNDARDSSGYL